MSARTALPFRPFFILAALESIVGVSIWLPTLAGWDSPESITGPVAGWHARELLFGAFPAMLSGFLLTALPRWTGRGFGLPHLSAWLAAFFLFGPASQLIFPAARPAIAAVYLTILTCVVGYQIQNAGDRRNLKILLLVALLACAGFLDLLAMPGGSDLSFRMALGAALGLVMVLGGRIIPSLTAVHLEPHANTNLRPRSRQIELAAAATATIALGAWIWMPESISTACLALAAAAGQTARCSRWQPWRTVTRPSVFALHGAYACIPIGFAVMSVKALDPGLISGGVAIHLWAIGAIGLMGIAVMASMIRRHLGRPLTESAALNVAFVLMAAALVMRTAAELLDPLRETLLFGTLGTWVAAHLLFLAGFRREFLLGRAIHRR
jgi:uncharacterized protein involved in response to NO